MKFHVGIGLALVMGLVFAMIGTTNAAEPVPPVAMIFDTDLGNDVDDTLALAIIHSFQDRKLCKLLAVTMTKDNRNADLFVKMLNTYCGYASTPIGYTHSKIRMDDDRYVKKVLDLKNEKGEPRYPVTPLDKGDCVYMDAVKLLRKTLAAQPDQSVVFVQVGFSTNMAALFDTKGDEYSPLNGKELFKNKVKFVSTMAANFKDMKIKEFNVVTDIPSAQKGFKECPVPVYFSGFEIGMAIPLRGSLLVNVLQGQEKNPVRDAFDFYLGLKNGAATFDLTSVLYAVLPNAGYFDFSPKGTVEVQNDGTVTFKEDPNGKHQYMKVSAEQRTRIAEAFLWLCTKAK